MKQRIRKIDRLIKVQQHLHKNAEIQLASLQRKEDELKTTQEDLLRSMDDSGALHGLLVDVVAKRLKMLALEETRTRAAVTEQRAVTIEKALQVKRSEKVFSRLKEDVRQEQEKKDLAAILELMVQKEGTSLQ